ncbi:MAG: prepilin-type N-terminal cleavage/methylation domain-containing protein [Moritella sp.]|nr:prepilin-type N-terminal cleavage/methylation domain-containing protein [Moritella sp.]
MKRRINGFTLIELVIVIIVLGVLAATAIPKFVNLQDDANRAALRGQFGAFASAVKLYHSGWLVEGHSGAVEDLAGFGDGDVSSTATGYPYSTSGTITPAFTACEELWTGITDTSFTIAYVIDDDLSSADVDIAYTYTGSTCVYRALHFMQRGQPTLVMNYDYNSGEVEVVDASYGDSN